MDIEIAMNHKTNITTDHMKKIIEEEIRVKDIHCIDDDGVNTKYKLFQLRNLPSGEYLEGIEDVEI